MPTHLTVEDHIELIRAAAAGLAESVAAAGMDALVPTCPEWTVRDLVAHQGMVHRWAAAHLRGEIDFDTDAAQAEGNEAPDPPGWLAEGAGLLIDTIVATPDEVQALVFLRNAPPPRHFWARRQAHETTIHSIDALSLRLGRLPLADETSVSAAAAADGIDELLTGFVPRRRSKLRSDDPFILVVNATDISHSWSVRVSEDPPATTAGATDDPDVVFTGTATQLYLGMWNRGDEITATGRDDMLDLWRATARVQWA